MSRMAAGYTHDHAQGHADGAEPQVAARSQLNMEDYTLAPGSFGMLRGGLWFAGVLGLVVTAIGFFSQGEHSQSHAMAAYQVGFLYALGLALGCLGMVMIFQQFNAGWCGAIRRQAENVASMIWVVALLGLPIVVLELGVTHGKLFTWMDPAHAAGDVVLQAKRGFLNPGFWAVRYVVYFAIWMYFATRLYKLSREQDQTGDRWLTAKARRMSSYGLLLFALTTAFASFDFLMSLDAHWFSTMFGVAFFAGSTLSAIGLMAVILGALKAKGKLGPAVTVEHLHDLGKLMFAFTVFWAYVTFSQYFLIWYSAVPEESTWYNIRNVDGWQYIGFALCVGQFVIPFLLLIFRPFKRNFRLMLVMGLWVMAAHSMDLFYMAKPTVHGVKMAEHAWLDLFGLLGPVCIFLAMVVGRIVSAPLIAIKDPRLQEVLGHKNYV